ncbi:GtrA-like protein [Nonomuraea polychroma]|uniref:GtrA-like protein n=1 Tax=Nonomuraea polychroma TaxID=46176 RepID=A0A438MFW5_9ACTN|nr:GtrA family protein [Nonomuraea polychroma]RVX44566.1 GtrA-like protein [Nonomuraea polychroma]
MSDVKNPSVHVEHRRLISLLRERRVTYPIGGAMTAAIYYGIVALALAVFGSTAPYLLLVVASHLTTVVIVYPWYRLVVFPDTAESWLTGYVRLYVVGLSFLAASLIGLPILVELASIPILVAQGVIICASLPLSYTINRRWTFRDHRSI